MNVVGNSYDELLEDVFVGEDPVDGMDVNVIRVGDEGEFNVSWDDLVDAGIGTVAV